MRLGVVGASGRMGRAVVRLARAQGIEIICAVGMTDIGRDAGDLAGIGPIGTPIVGALTALQQARPDVVIDFSGPGATVPLAEIVGACGSALVSGTTGLGEDARAAIHSASQRVPVLWEPNMSLGIHVLLRLVADAIAALPDWDIEIVETHHRAKVDAPSGTALRIAQTAKSVRGSGPAPVYGRHGNAGPRAPNEIAIHAIRGGDVVGDHVVCLMTDGERIDIGHRATNRDLFAHGAVRVARWIAGRPAGQYAMRDVLDVKT